MDLRTSSSTGLGIPPLRVSLGPMWISHALLEPCAWLAPERFVN